MLFNHNIQRINYQLGSIPLSCVSLGNKGFTIKVWQYTFDDKGFKTVPIKGIDDKRQVTATFAISMTRKFLPHSSYL